jgi:penicillin V acylase-like amidase (Ntn superfamily)
MLKKLLMGLAISAIFTTSPTNKALACTRAVFIGANNLIITGRSMDWGGPMGTNLWIFPRGLTRNGAAGLNSATWISKYGSVVTSIFDAGSADGMNEKGLVVNMLYLAETQYENPVNAETSKPISISAWVQYILDHYATVDEAVAALSQLPIYAVPTMSPDGHAGQVHIAISDATGDSAILEYVDGKLDIHHNRKYQVMTNSPVFDQQLALNKYWEQIGGTVMLPGTNRAADRFVRASFYINAIPKTGDSNLGVAEVFSVIRNASVPLGITTPGQPNISSTLWRTVSDQRDKVYYFESVRFPSIVWVNLSAINFGQGQPSKELKLETAVEASGVGGDVTTKFVPTRPFVGRAATTEK